MIRGSQDPAKRPEPPPTGRRPIPERPSSGVVLIGAGHAHLHVLADAERFRAAGTSLTVVDPGDFWYSGLATGVVGGRFAPARGRVDVADLAARTGARRIADRAVGVDLERCCVRLAGGGELRFDALSLNVGSEIAGGLPGGELALPVKPIGQLVTRVDPTAPTVVIGGGATGCEVAANLAARGAHVTLVEAGDRLIRSYPAGAARRLARYLEGRVDLRSGVRVRAVERGEDGLSVLTDSGRIEAAQVVTATGLVPPRWLRDAGLPLGPHGGIAVDARLRVPVAPPVFAVGDAIDFGPRPLPKLGVYAVREAPVLIDNLLASLAGRSLRPYRPQTRALSILNLGGGVGLAAWGRLWWLGRLAMLWKDRLDLAFLDRFAGA